jgi:hypothetical protein
MRKPCGTIRTGTSRDDTDGVAAHAVEVPLRPFPPVCKRPEPTGRILVGSLVAFADNWGGVQVLPCPEAGPETAPYGHREGHCYYDCVHVPGLGYAYEDPNPPMKVVRVMGQGRELFVDVNRVAKALRGWPTDAHVNVALDLDVKRMVVMRETPEEYAAEYAVIMGLRTEGPTNLTIILGDKKCSTC